MIGSECFSYNPEDNVWLFLQSLEVERSFASADIVHGCLVVTGGDTNNGPTDTVEVIGGNIDKIVKWEFVCIHVTYLLFVLI